LKVLRLQRGGTILFPAYHCGTELTALRHAGFQCAFYGIDRGLRMDMDEIDRLSGPDTCALYVIHYFGFPHPAAELRRLCTAKGWVLIEDCAHALFARSGGQPAGTYGDISIFSLHKFLPMPSAGGLLVNSPRPGSERFRKDRAPLRYAGRQTIDLFGRGLVRSAWMNTSTGLRLRGVISEMIRASAFGNSERTPSRAAMGTNPFLKEWRNSGPPWLSLKMLCKTPVREVFERRRRNYAALYEVTHGCRRIYPLTGALTEEACPLYFPAAVPEDPAGFLRACNRRGVMAHSLWLRAHPDFPAEEFPDASWLRKHVVVLPVHQGLNVDDLSVLRTVIQEWERDKR
jgi:dTDP-4-amino-4,6-dideoxygalactose transaminase